MIKLSCCFVRLYGLWVLFGCWGLWVAELQCGLILFVLIFGLFLILIELYSV